MAVPGKTRRYASRVAAHIHFSVAGFGYGNLFQLRERVQNRCRTLVTDAGFEAIEELEAKVAADHAQAAHCFRSESIEMNIDKEYVRENPPGVSYKQNKDDVDLLVREILKSKDVACVNGILQKWLRQLSSKSFPIDDLNAITRCSAVSYDEAVSVANGLIKEFGQRGSVQITMQVLEWMQYQNWFSLDPYLRIHIIDVLGKASCFDIAVKVFDHFIKISVKKDAGMYNALLNAFCKAGKSEAVLELFKDMKQSIKPNRLSYNLVMHSCVKAGQDLTKVVSLFKEMYLQGIKPDIFSYDILISACVNGKLAREARIFFENMKKQGLVPNVVTYTALITVYAASGNCSEALSVLQEMVKAACKPNAVTFTCLIHGYGHEGQVQEAEKMFQTMKRVGVEPNVITFNIMINLYSKSGNHRLAQSSFHQMIEAGLEPTFVTFTSLMYCFKAVGAYQEVLNIYGDVKGRDSLCNIYTYTEALDACLKWGNWPRVVDVLSDILAARCNPSPVTCNVVFMALSSKCKTVEDASILIDFLRSFDTKLLVIVRRLLLELLDGDDQVEALVSELGDVISPNDTRTWTLFSSGLVDALWTLGWHHRAATVLKWTLHKGYNQCACILTNGEWKLDLRRLSVGGALVAFYHWLKWLEDAAHATDKTGKFKKLQLEKAGGGGEHELLAGKLPNQELVLPLEKLVPGSRQERLFPSLLKFPKLITVITGWGKLSRVEGSSHVKEAVEKEIRKLDLPFRPGVNAGRWMTDGELLMVWLLSPDTAQKLTVSDLVSE